MSSCMNYPCKLHEWKDLTYAIFLLSLNLNHYMKLCSSTSSDHDRKHLPLFLSRCLTVVCPLNNTSFKLHHHMWQQSPPTQVDSPSGETRNGEKQTETSIVSVFPCTSIWHQTTFLLFFLIMEQLSFHTMWTPVWEHLQCVKELKQKWDR